MNSDILLFIFASVIGSFVFIIFRFGGGPIVNTDIYKELKEYAKTIKTSKTLYKTGVGLMSPEGGASKSGWHHSTRYVTLYVKADGLYIKLLNEKIGIPFNRIVSIDFAEKKTAIDFQMTITISFVGNVSVDKLILQSERNFLIIDSLKREYKGKINSEY